MGGLIICWEHDMSIHMWCIFTMEIMTSRDINTTRNRNQVELRSGQTRPTRAFNIFLFICLHRRIPLGVTSGDLNWLAREQGFASYPSGSASGLDLFYIRLPKRPGGVTYGPQSRGQLSELERFRRPRARSSLLRTNNYSIHSRSGHPLC
jgi:hypothetical protein